MRNEVTNEVRVGIADLAIFEAPTNAVTIGLGSCIGIFIHDEVKKNAALIHIMLPDSTISKEVTNQFKFADLAIPYAIKKLIEKGSRRENLIAKICGGAAMFKFSQTPINSEIGQRNGIAVKKILNEENINIKGEDLGGNKGRTVYVNAETGVMKIRVIGQETREI